MAASVLVGKKLAKRNTVLKKAAPKNPPPSFRGDGIDNFDPSTGEKPEAKKRADELKEQRRKRDEDDRSYFNNYVKPFLPFQTTKSGAPGVTFGGPGAEQSTRKPSVRAPQSAITSPFNRRA